MTATTHNLEQGTAAWLAFRHTKYGASEAPIMAGKSKYQNRSDLVKQKATGITPEVDAGKQILFDKGHAAEVTGRMMAEKILGEELSPVVMSDDINGLPLSASLDGVTFSGEIIFEHKLWSADLAKQIADGELDEHYTIQMDQQLLISSAEKCLFMASNGTECAHMWYKTTPEKCDKLIKGWMQFQKDVTAYVPTEEAQKVTAEAVIALPALAVQIKGEVTASNLPVFVGAADAFLARIKTVLETDQDFADAEANVKACKAAEDGIEQTKKAITAQATSIDEVIRTMDLYKEKLSTVRLQLDKLVKSEKIARKEAIVAAASKKFDAHVLALESEIKPIGLNRSDCSVMKQGFAEAMKGLKKLSAMQEAVDTALRDSMFALDTAAKDIRAKLAWCKENAAGHSALFPDLQALMAKPMEDFTLTITSRIEKQKEDEAARMEAETARIRAEEEAKARANVEAEAKAKAEAEKHATDPEYKPNTPDRATTLKAAIADSKVIPIAKAQTRPTDDQIIDAIALHFRVHESKAIEWLLDVDLNAACERMAKEFV